MKGGFLHGLPPVAKARRTPAPTGASPAARQPRPSGRQPRAGGRRPRIGREGRRASRVPARASRSRTRCQPEDRGAGRLPVRHSRRIADASPRHETPAVRRPEPAGPAPAGALVPPDYPARCGSPSGNLPPSPPPRLREARSGRWSCERVPIDARLVTVRPALAGHYLSRPVLLPGGERAAERGSCGMVL